MKRIVIKIGSAVLTHNNEIAKERMRNLVKLMAQLKSNYDIIIVTSGAIAAGYSVLKIDKNDPLNKKSLAAAGQPILMDAYKRKFAEYNINTAQILVTEDDFDSKKRTKMFQGIIDRLLNNGIIPIINENDTISTVAQTFGDNDQLSANVSISIQAELLVIFSDIDGYYDKNPHEFDDAKLFKIVNSLAPQTLEDHHTPNHDFATGGIVTKLKAADFMIRNGGKMFLCNGFNLDAAKSFLFDNNQTLGTLFQALEVKN